MRMRFGPRNDGTPDRVLAAWVVRAAPDTEVSVQVGHPRAGTRHVSLRIG